ncbi:MAG: endonuclease/exonuclease/phosphatase family protein [Gemmatimonadetes bacterium]|nr:endonuclease/exonuclease/phosphatase family protein [Gemmatimonadota bacterium]
MRDRSAVRRLVAGFFGAALLTLLLLGCSVHGLRPSPRGGALLRVMTYNIHHGAGVDERVDLERIAAVIRRENPDIVLLQEVDRGVERSGKRDLLRELATLTGLEHAAFGKNIDHQGGDYGNGLLSRYPIRREVNTWMERTTPGERRGVLQAIVDVRGREIAVLGTHLDASNGAERGSSARQIEQKLLPSYSKYPLILGGDLNEAPDGAVYRRLSALLADSWSAGEGPGHTIPVDAPNRRIDYIFHDRRFAAVAARVLRTDASDHLPLVADLRLVD